MSGYQARTQQERIICQETPEKDQALLLATSVNYVLLTVSAIKYNAASVQ